MGLLLIHLHTRLRWMTLCLYLNQSGSKLEINKLLAAAYA